MAQRTYELVGGLARHTAEIGSKFDQRLARSTRWRIVADDSDAGPDAVESQPDAALLPDPPPEDDSEEVPDEGD